MSSLRVLHIGDIHYCEKHLAEVDRCMGAAIEVARTRRPGLILIPGDTFDHRLEQNSPAFYAAVRAVCALSEVSPVFILQGTLSHDAPHAIEVFRHIASTYPVHVCTQIEQVCLGRDGRFSPIGPGWIPSDAADACVISGLPAVNKGHVAAAVGAEHASAAAGDAVASLLAGWAPIHERAASAGVPTIFTSHGTVSGCRTEHGVVMAGLDYEFTAGTIFASRAAASMLNHIHAHQAWSEDWAGSGTPARLIAYAGSVGRLHFGEHDPKGVLLWEVSPRHSVFEFIELPARELYEIEFQGPPDMAVLAEHRAKMPAGAYVRIRYALDEEHKASADREAMLALFETHAAEVKIEARILPVQRQRAAGIGTTPSVADKLSHWCALTSTDGDTADELLDRLRALQSHTPDQIAEGFA